MAEDDVDNVPCGASSRPGSVSTIQESVEDCDMGLMISQSEMVPGTGSSWLAAVFLIVNAALGAGLLDFPDAFDQAGGIFISMLIQAVFLGFAVISLLILAYCAKKHSCRTYQEVVLRTCGRNLERLCSTFISLYCYGTCITFLVIIGDLSDRTLSSLYGDTFCHYFYMERTFVMSAISVVFILPLCFPNRIDFLKYPSTLGVLAVFYIVFLIVYEFYCGNLPTPAKIKTGPDHWEDVLTVIPVICFGYQCHVSCVPIYSCMEDKRVKNFSKSLFAAIIICGVLYSFSGIYGYLTFGTGVEADILLSYDAAHPVVLVGLIALALKIITTYPILMFCGRLALEDLLPKSLYMGLPKRRRLIRRLIISFIWFSTTLVISCAVPNISVVIDCIGSMAALFIFVFPALSLIFITIHKDPLYTKGKTRVILVYSIISIAIGMFVFGQVLSRSMEQIITGDMGGRRGIVLCT